MEEKCDLFDTSPLRELLLLVAIHLYFFIRNKTTVGEMRPNCVIKSLFFPPCASGDQHRTKGQSDIPEIGIHSKRSAFQI